ncbi:hypothetical protein DCCM_2699 [Desulfocucumis palustris]|uniref:Uncharacterized protein n=1 Tax=Desulfocucumis palustris TaxID=1898651 RepID=A0A2L2XCZ4_9FIRM|nr:hypothetical protein DCCM_2699 [Desulfocucumis palustris]
MLFYIAVFIIQINFLNVKNQEDILIYWRIMVSYVMYC